MNFLKNQSRPSGLDKAINDSFHALRAKVRKPNLRIRNISYDPLKASIKTNTQSLQSEIEKPSITNILKNYSTSISSSSLHLQTRIENLKKSESQLTFQLPLPKESFAQIPLTTDRQLSTKASSPKLSKLIMRRPRPQSRIQVQCNNSVNQIGPRRLVRESKQKSMSPMRQDSEQRPILIKYEENFFVKAEKKLKQAWGNLEILREINANKQVDSYQEFLSYKEISKASYETFQAKKVVENEFNSPKTEFERRKGHEEEQASRKGEQTPDQDKEKLKDEISDQNRAQSRMRKIKRPKLVHTPTSPTFPVKKFQSPFKTSKAMNLDQKTPSFFIEEVDEPKEKLVRKNTIRRLVLIPKIAPKLNTDRKGDKEGNRKRLPKSGSEKQLNLASKQFAENFKKKIFNNMFQLPRGENIEYTIIQSKDSMPQIKLPFFNSSNVQQNQNLFMNERKMTE